MINRALIIFIKNPVPGRVKTRLAITVGDRKALQIYHKLSARIRRVAEGLPGSRYVFYSDFVDKNDPWDSGFIKKAQVGEGLGARMRNAVKLVLSEDCSPVVLIGSDIYGLEQRIIEQAFESLEKNDVVIGPALDGGYYLIGMNQLYSEAFDLESWSHESVLKDTLSQLQLSGRTVHLLETLKDIDIEADLKDTDLLD